ncbi:TPA: hypothetical protein ACU967_002277 [Burkholderia contaminans]|uniref:hypothetical protein n=1 Tax=Burkholderia contaminans TaxID=488447 RepID=UPI00158E028C|nr:hypothetical protein [Burkholderia contaminans]HDR9065519.1 hypothetical protein [Burkholderia vietnamiensis]MBM6427958.1 hypothetical protein [Burkholderia contaminans]MCA7876789.1 hypothetical protein [Burkholderia contaminans]MDN8024188.1 hypothetical protein [Burkholderia contaminans]HDR9071284.1 hypothetical protein [Burkholderia vietnamiensis]
MKAQSARFADWITAALIAFAVSALAGHESFTADNSKPAPRDMRGIQTTWKA